MPVKPTIIRITFHPGVSQSVPILNPAAIARNVRKWQEEKRQREAYLNRMRFQRTFNPAIT